MRRELPMAVCLFGWGRVFRLYRDSLEVEGHSYMLSDLTYIRSTYHHVLGIASARLELQFEEKRLLLRGIAAIEDVQNIIEYLTTHPEGPWEHLSSTSWQRTKSDSSMAVSEALPIVHVPLCLLTGEYAYYRVEATLCGEREHSNSSSRSSRSRSIYPAQDQGTLILTNKRLVYLGRKGQVVLDYAHLLHISHLPGAIAFHAVCWDERKIFEMPQSVECLKQLEQSLEQFRRETDYWEQVDKPTRAVPALSGAITLKQRIGDGDGRYINGIMEPRT